MNAKTRTGKIARLPKAIREQLNQRLADGETARSILDWLHDQEEAQVILIRQFESRPITEQNLSEWRRGGFQDWLERQEMKEALLKLEDDASDLEEATQGLATDRLSVLAAGALATVLVKLKSGTDWLQPDQMALLKDLCEQIGNLRRLDHSAKRLEMEREHLELEKAQVALAAEAQKKRTEAEWREWTLRTLSGIFEQSQDAEEALREMLRLLYGHADEALIREDRRRWRAKAGLPPEKEDMTLLEKIQSNMELCELQKQQAQKDAGLAPNPGESD